MRSVHPHFVYARSTQRPRMHWKVTFFTLPAARGIPCTWAHATNSRCWAPAEYALLRPLAPQVSIDLSRPLVPSEGNLDPFDGLVTCSLLAEAAGPGSAVLSSEIADLARIVEAKYRG